MEKQNNFNGIGGIHMNKMKFAEVVRKNRGNGYYCDKCVQYFGVSEQKY